MKKRTTVKYLNIFYLATVLFFIVVFVRLSYVALSSEVDGMNIKAFAENRNTVEQVLYASRGNIYDISGDLLAETVNSYTVIAYLEEKRTENDENPRHVVDVTRTAKALAPILGLDEQSLIDTLSKDKYQVELKKNITELTKSKIDELELPGIGFENSVTRYYQTGSFASYLVGYAKTDDEGKITGELGIEGYYDELLSGTDGYTTYQKDAYGYKIPNVPEYTTDAISGANIHLTLDSKVQLIAENAINKIAKDYEHEWAIMTVMDANTGAIVASATSPSFNPNDLNTIENYLNPLISYQYEPGSTMKTFSFAAAIEEGLYDGTETFKSGSVDVADVTIRDYNKTGWGEISYDTGYAYSSNVATTNLALKLGTSTLHDYYADLGFGTQTGIDLSGEVTGKVDFYYQSELANASFGQGISTTPIQLMQAYTTMTNDGTMLKPYIVDKIVDENGEMIYEGGREEVGKVYSKTTTDYMQKLMYDAVYNGTSKVWQPENVSIIGKTGTAQIASPSGGYLDGEFDVIRSFATIFPEQDPKYILYIAVEKFQSSTTNLANITTTAIEEIASYANITNEVFDDTTNKIVLNNYISTKTSETIKNLETTGLNIIVLGDGKYITNQHPLKNSVVFAGDRVFLKTNSNNIIMPDLTGYSASEVKTFANLCNLKVSTDGYGYVVSQNIAVGTVLTNEMILEVGLE